MSPVRFRAGGGGGGGGGGNVAWGPDFGEDNGSDGVTRRVGVNLDLATVDVRNDKTVGVAPQLTALDPTYNAQSIGIDILGDLGYRNTKTVGVNHDLAAVDVLNEKTVGVNHDLVSVDTANQKTLGVHLSGTVLGAPFYQSTTTVETSTAATSVVIPAPSGMATGDMVLVFLANNIAAANVGSVSFPDFTLIRRDDHASGALYQWALYRFVTASEPSSYTISWTSSVAAFANAHHIKGAAAIDNSGGTASDTVNPVAPSITTAGGSRLIFCAAVQNVLLNQDYTAPTNYTERSDQNANGLLGALNLVGTSDSRVLAASPTGTATMTSSETLLADQTIAQHVAISPAAFTIAP